MHASLPHHLSITRQYGFLTLSELTGVRCCARANMILCHYFHVQVATLEQLMVMLQVGWRCVTMHLVHSNPYPNARSCMHRVRIRLSAGCVGQPGKQQLPKKQQQQQDGAAAVVLLSMQCHINGAHWLSTR
jgi:hypothetical protein